MLKSIYSWQLCQLLLFENFNYIGKPGRFLDLKKDNAIFSEKFFQLTAAAVFS
jgi:hypothetical protein